MRVAHAGVGSVELPTGTVTFLFTDIEGSTASAAEMGDEKYAAQLADHRERLFDAIDAHRGVVFGTEGDAVFAAFARASDAVAAAVDGQRALSSHAFRVRMGLHTGEAMASSGDYVGITVHQAARVAAAGHGGQIVLSEATRQLAGRDLPDGAGAIDLGVHQLKDLAEPQHLFQLRHDDLVSEFPPLRSLAGRLHNLPLQLTSFVGREEELLEVETLVVANRLVTLTGVGGCGKTRLALHAAAELLDRFPDGVWLVDLAPIERGTLVAQAAASALGVAEAPAEVIDAVVQHIGSRNLLLVLDNCEHLAADVADFVEMVLRRCPALHVLATSREYLGVSGEVTLQVASLSVPETAGVRPSEELVRYAAVRLFMERALAADPSFVLGPGDPELVSRVCRRLDGIPLAIELAAPKIRMFDLTEIERRLDDRFRLLSGGTRRGLGRQQTLRATVDWSHDLLSEPERLLLRRLAVFSGGFTFEAAGRVCADDDLLDADTVADVLEQLVGRSLAVVDRTTTGTRYRQLETIRQYGLEKLAQAGEVDTLRAKHLGWCADLAAEAEPELFGINERAWLDRLDADGANVRAALDWALDHDPCSGLRLAISLARWWSSRGGLTEGRQRLSELLDRAGPTAGPQLRAQALITHARCAGFQDDLLVMRELCSEGADLARAAGDREMLALALTGLGFAVAMYGDPVTGLRHLAESREAFQTIDPMHPQLTATYANTANVMVGTGDSAGARHWLEQAVAHAEKRGHLSAVAFCSAQLARVLEMTGDHAAAAARRARGLELARQIGDRRTLAAGLREQVQMSIAVGDYAAVRVALAEAQELVPHVGEIAAVSVQLWAVVVELGDGDFELGLSLADAALSAIRRMPDALNRIDMMDWLAEHAGRHGALRLAAACGAEAVAEARQSPHPNAWWMAAVQLAFIESDLGNHETASRRCEEVVAAMTNADAPAQRVLARFVAAMVALAMGALERAEAHVGGMTVGDPSTDVLVDFAAGTVALERGDWERSRVRLAAAIDRARAAGKLIGVVLGLVARAELDQRASAPGAAESCREAIAQAHAGRFPVPLAAALETATLVLESSDPDRAAHLLGATAALRNRLEAPVPPRSAGRLEKGTAATRAALGDERFAEARAAGQAMGQEAAVHLALEGLARS